MSSSHGYVHKEDFVSIEESGEVGSTSIVAWSEKWDDNWVVIVDDPTTPPTTPDHSSLAHEPPRSESDHPETKEGTAATLLSILGLVPGPNDSHSESEQPKPEEGSADPVDNLGVGDDSHSESNQPETENGTALCVDSPNLEDDSHSDRITTEETLEATPSPVQTDSDSRDDGRDDSCVEPDSNSLDDSHAQCESEQHIDGLEADKEKGAADEAAEEKSAAPVSDQQDQLLLLMKQPQAHQICELSHMETNEIPTTEVFQMDTGDSDDELAEPQMSEPVQQVSNVQVSEAPDARTMITRSASGNNMVGLMAAKAKQRVDSAIAAFNVHSNSRRRICFDETVTHIGLQVEWAEPMPVVAAVKLGGEADQRGIHLGDSIARVNGADAAGKARNEILQMLKARPLVLELERKVCHIEALVKATAACVNDCFSQEEIDEVNVQKKSRKMDAEMREKINDINEINNLKTVPSESDLIGMDIHQICWGGVGLCASEVQALVDASSNVLVDQRIAQA